MNWGWINTFGAIIVALILLPNIIYTCKNKHIENKCANRLLNVLEQIGRYGSMALMFLNIGVPEFGFWSMKGFGIWLFSIPALLLIYWIGWFIYFKKPYIVINMLLAIIPSIIFILNGILLGHWLLIIFGTAFAISHGTITYKNCTT